MTPNVDIVLMNTEGTSEQVKACADQPVIPAKAGIQKIPARYKLGRGKVPVDSGLRRNDDYSEVSEQFWAAVRRYWKHLDQRWSLTDCVSFLIMERQSIRDALAHDRGFAAAGFRPLLRDG